jgi:hypothetical protein
MNTKKLVDVVLVAGFVLVDWLIFHDAFKAGQSYTTTEILTGVLSLFVFLGSLSRLLNK